MRALPTTPGGPANPLVDAFLLYRPHPKRTDDRVTYNSEAHRILAPKHLTHSKETNPPPDVLPLCVRWKQSLDTKMPPQIDSNGETPSAGYFLEFYQSWRRRYLVRGCVLSDNPSSIPGTRTDTRREYLFILERAASAIPYLDVMCRQWQLSQREQEIVRLLFDDHSNQEIAEKLNLSVHTIKTYLKLLMRKLGATSRAGVICRLLTGTPPSSQ